MAKLKTSELRLLIAFGVMIIGLGSLIGYRMLTEKKDLAEQESIRLQGEISLYRNLLEERDLWDSRRNWFNRKLPLFTSPEAEAPKLEGIVNEAARITGASIDTPRPIALKELGNDIVQIGLALGVSGTNDEIVRFLALLQYRDAFRRMETLNLKPDKKEPEIVRCELTLGQLYIRGDMPVISPTEAPEPAAPEPTAPVTASSAGAEMSAPPVN